MVLLAKKDFFSNEVCPLYFSEKYRSSKSEQIHRKVKCAHLVSEPVHRKMHHTDVVPELAGRRSMSLVARSKKLKLSSPIHI